MVSITLSIISALVQNLITRNKLVILSEGADWVIKGICEDLVLGVNHLHPGVARLSYLPTGIRNSLLHFGSINPLVKDGRIRAFHPSNKTVLTWYHILPDDERIPLIPEIGKRMDVVHTACTRTRRMLLEHGIPKEKLILIPESVDRKVFYPATADKRQKIRTELGLPGDRWIIGSFQKDGVGWGDGMEPKLIKGPDVFCDAVIAIAKNIPVHVLLTGPARGYVKKRLDDAGISYTHHFLKDPRDIAPYYRALDLYVVASREEGGPKAILESFASGVPLISMRVGMAEDVIRHRENGFLVDVGDVSAMVLAAEELFAKSDLRVECQRHGLETAERYDTPAIIGEYVDLVYRPLMPELFHPKA